MFIQKKWHEIKKIKYKISISVATTLVVILILFSYVEIREIKVEMLDDIDNKLNSLADIAMVAVSDSVWDFNEDGIMTIGDALYRDREIAYVIIYDEIKEEVYNKSKAGEVYQSSMVKVANRDILYMDSKIGRLTIGLTNYYLNKKLERQILTKIILIAAVTIVSMTMVVIISQVVTKPLKILENSTEEITLGNYDKKIEIESNDELGSLARKFDKMRENILYSKEELKKLNESLEDRVEERTMELFSKNQELLSTLEVLESTRDELIKTAEKTLTSQLVASVAHEINTPLGAALTMGTYLIKCIEILKKEAKEKRISRKEFDDYINDVLESARTIQSYIEESAKLIEYFKQLDIEKSEAQLTRFNVGAHIEDILKGIYYEYKYRDVEIKVVYDNDIEIMSYPNVYFELFSHLIIYSLEYSFTGMQKGLIMINLDVADNQLIISYSDNGTPLETEHVKHIFEPFYKVMKGREQRDYRLPIVKSIVTSSLQGAISVEENSEGQTQFIIKLPLEHN